MKHIARTLTLLILFCATLRAEAAALPQGFVHISDVLPEAVLDIRYHGTDNFVGGRIDGYLAPTAILTQEAAEALRHAVQILRAQGCGVKVFDAYRPQSAVRHFVRWSRDLADQRNKARFYPDVDKGELFHRGYIASRSAHSRGSVVDLTLVDLATGRELDMGTPYDFFGPASHHGAPGLSPQQAKNRKTLREAMEGAGFQALRSEWWHYRLAREPFLEKYFDFPVDGPTLSAYLASLPQLANADKAVLVTGNAQDSRASVHALERRGETWRLLHTAAGRVGKNGIRADRREGGGSTPAGVFPLRTAFGIAENPGTSLSYRRLQPGDVWVDDPASAHYNRPARSNQADRDWKSAEDLYAESKAYKYAIVIGYNDDPIVPGKGSAIFLHCLKNGATAGCVAVPERTMLRLLGFVDDRTKIVIAVL